MLDDPLYVRAVVKKKGDKSELPSWKRQMKGLITPKKRPKKEQALIVKAKKSKGSEKSPTPKLLSPVPSSIVDLFLDSTICLSFIDDVQSPTKSKQKKKKKKQLAPNGTVEASLNQDTEQCKQFPNPTRS